MLSLDILALLYATSALMTSVFAVCKLSLNVVRESTVSSVSFGVYEGMEDTKSIDAEKFSVRLS